MITKAGLRRRAGPPDIRASEITIGRTEQTRFGPALLRKLILAWAGTGGRPQL